MMKKRKTQIISYIEQFSGYQTYVGITTAINS